MVLRLIVYLLALAAIALGIGSFFKITVVQTSGNVIYSSQELVDAAQIELGSNLFLLDTGAVKERILSEKLFVDSVNVRRKMPDTIVLEVRESQLLACFRFGGSYFVVNRRCQILSKGDEASVAGYIVLEGLEPLAPRVGEKLVLSESEGGKLRYLEDVMAVLLDRELYHNVLSIDAANPAALKLDYQGRLTVNLGSNEQLERKFDVLEGILKDLSDYDDGVIDLSTPGQGHYIPG